ncbi:MAG: hypothetical protein ACXIUQ_08685 [Cecembia sp.]
MKYLKFAVGLIFFLSGCTSERTSSDFSRSFSWVFQDSIQVAYMGELFLLDYDPKEELYLGRWNAQEEYVVFDESGQIKHTFKLSEDGPNTIGWVQGLNFLEESIAVMDQSKGLHYFSPSGVFQKKQEIPAGYFFINGLNFAAYPVSEELAYIRPERGESILNYPSMMQNVYASDILEVLNPTTGETRTTMPFPSNTVYSSGNFYNWTFPNILKHDNEWILWMLAEQKYFVYKEEEGEILLSKVVDLNLKDAIPMPGISMNQYNDWYEQYGNVIFGRIEQIYRRDDDVVVIYTKGVSEEIANQYSRDNWEEWMAFLESIPRYAAIFDTHHELIQKDLLVPKGIRLSSVVNNNGAIIAQKNQEFFGVEEDVLTFYELEFRGEKE